MSKRSANRANRERAARPLAPPTLPDQAATFKNLDPAAALAFRTPLQEHTPAADTKATALLTAFGLMFTILARYADHVRTLIEGPGYQRLVLVGLLIGYAVCSSIAVVRAFRTLTPRFPALKPSLAFFTDIAALSRDEYIRRVETMPHEEALDHIISYNHNLSAVIVAKFAELRLANKYFRYGFLCWTAAMVLIGFKTFS